MCTNKKHAENLLHARGKFSGRIGYVLAVAGSAVGLGNIWRFPYLAAKYGGGMFLLVYLILMVTFGYVMIVSETALGRMTKKSPVGAFHKFGKSLPFHLGGWINAVIPMMIIPAVFAFSGGDMETLQAGPALTFITLPKVFASMGVGTIVGIAFFLMFLFAALTSAISLLETSVSTLNDELHWSRGKCCLLMVVVMLVIGTASSFGYGIWDSVKILGMQFLDFFDFLTNSVMMPIAALATCILILKVVGFKRMDAEIEQSSDFKRKKLYHFFLKYLASACVIIILLSSIANVLGWISM